VGASFKMNQKYHKQVQTKLTKGLLDMIVLQFLTHEDMHGYQIISKIKKDYGISFGPSTVYPLLGLLEKKGYIESTWNTDGLRARKIYHLTNEGKNVLLYTENSLNIICRNLIESKTQTITDGITTQIC
jgi:PadR family transcriptional regulator, regulatory protein PadR